MEEVILKWGGQVEYRKKIIGRWTFERSDWNGKTIFRGRIGYDGKWSSWMSKGELRSWFKSQFEEAGTADEVDAPS